MYVTWWVLFYLVVYEMMITLLVKSLKSQWNHKQYGWSLSRNIVLNRVSKNRRNTNYDQENSTSQRMSSSKLTKTPTLSLFMKNNNQTRWIGDRVLLFLSILYCSDFSKKRAQNEIFRYCLLHKERRLCFVVVCVKFLYIQGGDRIVLRDVIKSLYFKCVAAAAPQQKRERTIRWFEVHR